MPSQFRMAADVERDTLTWGTMGWVSNPPSTGARQLTVIDVTLVPGEGHNFHKHPDQEEVIFVVAGIIEQWVGEEQRLLQPGDAVYIDPGVVHASFNVSSSPAHLLAILSLCVGAIGYELVDVAGEAPWNKLRA